jgi:hypothetical protein
MPTFRSHVMRLVPLDVPNAVAYTRPGVEGSAPALVLLNFDNSRSKITLPNRSDVREVIAGGPVTDLLTGDPIRFSGDGKLRMDQLSALVLVPEAES